MQKYWLRKKTDISAFAGSKKDVKTVFFEFRIRQDQLTGPDVALIVIDYAEEQDKDDAIELWNMQIARLKHVIGL